MKRITSAWLFLSIFSFVYAQERVIEHPPFIAWNTSALEIDKVILSDTATVLEITGFSKAGNWIAIASSSKLKDDNGRVYPIRSGQGIQLDEHLYMPKSGQSPFRLIFDPVPKSATFIDFAEGDEVRGAFCIWGIQLQSKTLPPLTLPQEAIIHKPDMNASLPEPRFQYGKAVLKITVPDYQKGMGDAMIFLGDASRAMGASEFKKFNDSKTIRYETQLVSVTPGKLRLNNREFDYLLAPGEETEIIINFSEMSRRQSRLHRDSPSYGEPVYYNGYLPGLQQELANNRIKTTVGDNYEKMLAEIDGMDIDGVTNYLLGKHQEISQKIAQAPISQACKEVLQADVDLSAADRICAVNHLIPQAKATSFNIAREEMIKYLQANRMELPDSQFLILKEKFPVINQPKAMYAFNNLFFTRGAMHQKEQMIKAFGTSQGILFDNLVSMAATQSIQEFTPLTEQQESMLAGLSSPAYLERAQALNKELLASIENRKKRMSNVSTMDIKEVSNDDLYTALVSKHRGKVVLIDIWATWCAPCRHANKEMKPLKEEWKDKDIVFVYVAGENSPEKLWEEMSAEISGEHHRLTNDQFKYLMESFNASGVPTYIVVDKDGSVSRVMGGYPGLDAMKKELLKAGLN